jgi:hypothetical protein
MRAIGRQSVASFISVVLSFLRFGVALGLIFGAIGTLVLPFISSPNVTVTVPVSFSFETPTPIRTGRPGFGFQILNEKEQAREDRRGRIDRVDGSLKIPGASKNFILANAIVLIVIFALALYVIEQLRAVLRTLIHGNPFVAENATRIRRVAFAVIIGEFARSLIVFAENHYAMTHVAIAGLRFDAWPRVSVSTIIYGLIILVIAEVFRAGTRLDEEQSLTI